MESKSAVLQIPTNRNSKTETKKRPQKISATKRRRLIAKAKVLRGQGMTQAEIAAELKVGKGTVATLIPKKIKPRADTISGSVLVEWIEAHSEDDPYAGQLVEGTPMTDSQVRAVYRWREENVNPRLETVENALISWGETFAEFESWAESKGLMIWEKGTAPDWWMDAGNSREIEDLNSTDPEWVAEARARGVVRREHSQVLVAA